MRESLQGWGSADPDDLAVLVCASMHQAGVVFAVNFRFDGDKAIGIEVHRGEGGSLVAFFPMHPIPVNGVVALDTLRGAIETLGRLTQRLSQKHAPKTGRART